MKKLQITRICSLTEGLVRGPAQRSPALSFRAFDLPCLSRHLSPLLSDLYQPPDLVTPPSLSVLLCFSVPVPEPALPRSAEPSSWQWLCRAPPCPGSSLTTV